MFRNYLAVALRNLLRNKLYAAINIVGIAVGFTAAIFAALFVRNALTYDRWISGYDRVYAVATTFSPDLRAASQERVGLYREAAPALTLDFPEVESASRLGEQGGTLCHGDVRAREAIKWADLNFFSTVPISSVAGDLRTALERPDAIVITRALARKYFGRDAPIGETMLLDQKPMQVTAVIEDWPSNSTFTNQAFVSERAPFLFWKLRQPWDDVLGDVLPPYALVDETFVRLKPDASIQEMSRGLSSFEQRHVSRNLMGQTKVRLIPLSALHLHPAYNTSAPEKLRRLLAAIAGIAGVGAATVLAAVINFVNATTARASRRAVEVGVRKATGARRRDLIAQFLGESTIYTALGMIVAAGLVTVLLPAFQAFVESSIPFEPWHDPALAAAMAVVALITGVAAGAYPALILSGLRPAVVLKAGAFIGNGSGLVRQGLVVVQFAILIVVGVVTIVIDRQTHFAMNEGLRFDKNNVLQVLYGCTAPIKSQARMLPGVRGAACTWAGIGGAYDSEVALDSTRNGVDVGVSPIDYEFFDIFGVKPLAGRFFLTERGEDFAVADGSTNPSVVINESAVHKLGFASPGAAIGKTVWWRRMLVERKPVASRPLIASQVIGVVADLPRTVERPVSALIYYADMSMAAPAPEYGPGWDVGQSLFLKLTDTRVSETLRAIDRLWDKFGDPRHPVERRFLSQDLEAQYRDVTRQGQLFGVFTAAALFIATIGLFGLSAYLAEQRTKEIGIRKSLGASRADVLRLLVWQFTKPVLGANVIAWPAAYFLMQHWLDGFAYHIDLELWMFAAASAVALLIAAMTVSGHALLVARAEPVVALRYE